MDTYYRPTLLRQALAAILRQTYENLEIILVNNGATPESLEILYEAAASDQRVKLIHFEKNQFSWDDPQQQSFTCGNAGLAEATGDYIWYQADDDILADDYAEKMVALFENNPDCTTAAGIPVRIDIDGNILISGLRPSNYRPRYMPGHILALDRVRGGITMFSAPGEIFTIRRDVFLKAGGFHRDLDSAYLYGIVPFGVTGFDETAIFYSRSHAGQMNRLMSERGLLGISESFAMLNEYNIKQRWNVFGEEVADEVVSDIESQTCDRAAYWFVHLINHWKLSAAIRVFRKTWRRGHFWSRMASYEQKDWRTLIPMRTFAKFFLRQTFRLPIGLEKIFPGVATRIRN